MQAESSLDVNFYMLIMASMKHLQEYLKTHKAVSLAQAVGVSAAYISDLKKGHRRPSLRVALAIENETSGLVPAASWQSDGAQ